MSDSGRKEASIAYDGAKVLKLNLENCLKDFDPRAIKALQLKFLDPNNKNLIVDTRVMAKDIAMDISIKGYSMPLDTRVNDALYDVLNQVQHMVCIDAQVIDNDEMLLPGVSLFLSQIDGVLTRSSNAKAQGPQKVDFEDEKKAQEDAAAKANAEADAAAKARAEAEAAAAAAKASAQSTDKKSGGLGGLLLKLIGFAICCILLILLALYLLGVFKGLGGGAAAPAAPQPQEAAAQEENTDEEAAEEETAAEDTAENAQSEEQTDEIVPDDNAAAQTSDSAASECSLSSKSDAEILKGCVASKADAKALKALAVEALKSNRCDLGKRILIGYGRQIMEIAVLNASYYDPNSKDNSGCIKKDKQQAAYWYETALKQGESEDAKRALEALK